MALDVEILAIDNIESAKSTMAGIGVTARGQEIMAEKMVFRVVRLRDIDTRAANILKQTMLSNGGEAAVSAATVNLSAEKTDVILAGTLKNLRLAAKRLEEQPWGLKSVAIKLCEILEQGRN